MRHYRLFSGVLTLGVFGRVEIIAFRVIGQIVQANFFLGVAHLPGERFERTGLANKTRGSIEMGISSSTNGTSAGSRASPVLDMALSCRAFAILPPLALTAAVEMFSSG